MNKNIPYLLNILEGLFIVITGIFVMRMVLNGDYVYVINPAYVWMTILLGNGLILSGMFEVLYPENKNDFVRLLIIGIFLIFLCTTDFNTIDINHLLVKPMMVK